jgi:transcriptional regulator with XRE-family HTH domain
MRLAVTFGVNVRRLRKERGWSQEVLADAVGLAPTYVGQLERGRRNPTLEVVERFARVLEVEALDLLIAQAR